MNDILLSVIILVVTINALMIGYYIGRVRNRLLVDALEEYIKFISDYIDNREIFLKIHHQGCSQEDFEKGEKLRKKIQEAKK